MKVEMTPTNRAIIAVVAVVALGVAFWMLALSPKREEAKKLSARIEKAESSVEQHRAEVAEGERARRDFSSDYHQLVVLGKAVPGDDDSASLLVQLNRIGERAEAEFKTISLDESSAEAPPPTPVAAPEGGGATAVSTPISPTEAAAATMPLGAQIGPAGLGVMPYGVGFEGDFFKIADFIGGLDSLVDTHTDKVSVNGRLITIDGFVLEESGKESFPALDANFEFSTYLTPPNEGVTAGATPTAPAPTTATPASTSIGATP